MTKYPVPANEVERNAALRTYEIMNTPPEIPYDDVNELAAQICECPVAYVSFIEDDRFWFKSKYGLPPDFQGCPREIAFCSVTICGQEIVIANDLRTDARYKDFPFVVGEPHYGFYCSVPLVNPQGYTIGTLCVMDFEPRELSHQQLDSLRRLGRQLMITLEHRRQLLQARETNAALKEAHSNVALERDRAEHILRTILPGPIAEELKTQGSVEPRYHPAATILFTDFQGFTRVSERIEPAALVSLLDQCFSGFDEISVRRGLERLKTIGDAFMAVAGLPTANRTHPLDACLAALEMHSSLRQLNERRAKLRLPTMDLRIGLHTGPVMAGIVGRRKYTYDIWGDAVNLAARLESACEPHKTNVSASVVAQASSAFEFEPRGKLDAKNKGPVDMFFLKRLKPEYSADAAGEKPNDAFLKLLESSPAEPTSISAPMTAIATGPTSSTSGSA